MRRRAAGIALALAAEALLVLLFLTIAPQFTRKEPVEMSLSSFDVLPDAEREAEQAPAPAERAASRPEAERPTTRPVESNETSPRAEEPERAPPLPIIHLSREQMATADIGAMPSRSNAPGRATVGPPASGTARASGDSERVDGLGPNGEPLYAASWYRKPYDDELRGYLSTAKGPGWGLIACRTVADFRVEDCVALGESPQGSNISRAVLAAAWQFRVRPPQIGGRPQVGEWVRIRIDYELRQR